MGTKNNPDAYDCYANADPDEPMFVLLARDKHAPTMIWLWATLRELDGDIEKARQAHEVVAEMLKWQKDNGRKPIGIAQCVLAGVFELMRAANYSVNNATNIATDADAMRLFFSETKFEERAPHEEPTL